MKGIRNKIKIILKRNNSTGTNPTDKYVQRLCRQRQCLESRKHVGKKRLVQAFQIAQQTPAQWPKPNKTTARQIINYQTTLSDNIEYQNTWILNGNIKS